ncbi:MAG: hypothetical protein ACPGTU_07455 [Myxococcota bacterium]
MLQRFKEQIKTTQNLVAETSQQVLGQKDELLGQARHRAHLVRGEGAQRLWEIEVQALDWADDVIARNDLPAVEVVTEQVSKLIQQRKDSVLANPIEEYDSLNARAAAAAVRELSWVDLLKIEKIERVGKGRKTVFEAIERRQNELEKPPFRENAA